MLQMDEQHSNKYKVEDNKESMETITQVAKSTMAAGSGATLRFVVEKSWETHNPYYYDRLKRKDKVHTFIGKVSFLCCNGWYLSF